MPEVKHRTGPRLVMGVEKMIQATKTGNPGMKATIPTKKKRTMASTKTLKTPSPPPSSDGPSIGKDRGNPRVHLA